MNFSEQTERWKAIADSLMPQLNHQWRTAVSIVRMVPDSTVWQGIRSEEISSVPEILDKELPETWEYIFDFGEYCVGYPEIELEFRGVFDAPYRLEYKLSETPYETITDFQTEIHGLSRSWFQDGVITVDEPVKKIRFPRRGAFRYLTLKSFFNSRAYHPVLKAVKCDCVSSADFHLIPAKAETLEEKINRISLVTLASCMQEVFEDGPKRDRRLWLGDLRIQALANYNSFRNYGLVKRCLYLFAAGCHSETGRIPGCIYRDHPHPSGGCYIFDYSIMFGDILLDYIRYSGDIETGKDLFRIAVHQCELALEEFENGCFKDFKRHWLFIDWRKELQKECPEHCVVIYAMSRVFELAELLGMKNELPRDYQALTAEFRKKGREKWFDPVSGFFTENGQYSWAAQIWAAYAELLPEESTRNLLRELLQKKDFLQPGGPYLYNQLVLVLMKYGLEEEARKVIHSYWGAMVSHGADAFWEFYLPDEPMFSAYGNAAVNSHCHAWSTVIIP